MALTSGERAALWRKRQRQDPLKHSQYKEKERERYRKRKMKGEIKSINDMTEREKRKKRRNWRVNQRRKRENEKKIKETVLSQLSPPTTPEEIRVSDDERNRRTNQLRNRGRKKKNQNRSRAYREIFRLRIVLDKERRLKNKYKKRFYRLQTDSCKHKDSVEKEIRRVIQDTALNKKYLRHYCVLVRNIKQKYQNSRTADRRIMKSLLYRKATLRKYKIGTHSTRMMGITEPRIRRKTHIYERTQSTLKKSVTDFYERDDNSRVKAGKKSTKTKRKIKKQIRLLNDSLKNLHQKYLLENKSKISYSLFAKMKPFWVKFANEKDRETCLCKVHENPTLKMNKLYSEHVLAHKDINKLLEDITCDTKNKACMYRTCQDCRDKKIVTRPDHELQLGKIVDWRVWRSRIVERERKIGNNECGSITKHNITMKETETATITTLLNELQTDIERLARHQFNITHQYSKLRNLKDSLKDNELIIHMDFSENYMCKYTEEIQSVHFGASKRQISIHTIMCYTRGKSIPVATVSDNLSHGPCGIWAHLRPVIQYIKNLIPGLTKLHVISDGPTTQYRCKTNFYLFATKLSEHGFTDLGTWNFTEAGHGKGAPDGIGAVLKRTADTLVNTHGHEITRAADLVTGLRKLGSAIEVFEVSSEDIIQQERSIPADIPAIPGTMKLHQVVVINKQTVRSRVLSCFCADDCACFDPVTTQYQMMFETPTEPNTNGASESDKQNNATKKRNKNQPRSSDMLDEHTPALSVDEKPTETHDVVHTVLLPIVDFNEKLVGRFCVVEYDGLPYPGQILDIDEEDVEVKAMCRIGVNRFFWPLVEDRLQYKYSKVLSLLDSEPEHVTKRHQKLDDILWKALCDHLGLDDQGKISK